MQAAQGARRKGGLVAKSAHKPRALQTSHTLTRRSLPAQGAAQLCARGGPAEKTTGPLEKRHARKALSSHQGSSLATAQTRKDPRRRCAQESARSPSRDTNDRAARHSHSGERCTAKIRSRQNPHEPRALHSLPGELCAKTRARHRPPAAQATADAAGKNTLTPLLAPRPAEVDDFDYDFGLQLII